MGEKGAWRKEAVRGETQEVHVFTSLRLSKCEGSRKCGGKEWVTKVHGGRRQWEGLHKRFMGLRV